MSDLSGSERRKLEKLLGMGGGYVLNFSDRTFGDFFDEYRVEIDAERYKARGTSKANRMRTFWDVDGNHVVGRVIGGLIEYATDEQCFGDSNPLLIDDCRKIAQRGGVSPNRRKFRHAKSRAQRVPPPTWISGSVLLTKVSRM